MRSGASNMTCERGHRFRRVHARTGLAGARRMQFLQMRKVLYIFLTQLPPPPRAGTTGICYVKLRICFSPPAR